MKFQKNDIIYVQDKLRLKEIFNRDLSDLDVKKFLRKIFDEPDLTVNDNDTHSRNVYQSFSYEHFIINFRRDRSGQLKSLEIKARSPAECYNTYKMNQKMKYYSRQVKAIDGMISIADAYVAFKNLDKAYRDSVKAFNVIKRKAISDEKAFEKLSEETYKKFPRLDVHVNRGENGKEPTYSIDVDLDNLTREQLIKVSKALKEFLK
jgi:hypothetical protein